MTRLPQALLLAAPAINLLLLLIVAEGAVVLRAAEASAGRALSCVGWYKTTLG